MYTFDMFVTPLISSVVAAIAIMISSEIIEHNLEAKHAIVMALAANIAAALATPLIVPFLNPYLPAITLIGTITTTTLIIDLAFWVILSFVIMTNSFTDEKIKIAIYGFVITTAVVAALPYLWPTINSMIGTPTNTTIKK